MTDPFINYVTFNAMIEGINNEGHLKARDKTILMQIFRNARFDQKQERGLVYHPPNVTSSSTTENYFNRLPDEILILILEFVGGTRSVYTSFDRFRRHRLYLSRTTNLMNCSLVERRLYQLATPLLYRRISIVDHQSGLYLLQTLATSHAVACLVEELHFETFAPKHLNQISTTPVDTIVACSRLQSFTFRNQFRPASLPSRTEPYRPKELRARVLLKYRAGMAADTMPERSTGFGVTPSNSLLHLDTTLDGLSVLSSYGRTKTVTFLRITISEPKRVPLLCGIPRLPALTILTIYIWGDIDEQTWIEDVEELLQKVGGGLKELAISEQRTTCLVHEVVLAMLRGAPSISTLRIKGSTLFELDDQILAHPTVETLILKHNPFGPSNDRFGSWIRQLNKKHWPLLNAVQVTEVSWDEELQTSWYRKNYLDWSERAKENGLVLLDRDGQPVPTWIFEKERDETSEEEDDDETVPETDEEREEGRV